jgi:CO/xanthine dehydrogenase FAD-binding subunit
LIELVQIRPNGLHLSARATLQQLAGDETLNQFASGLVSQALACMDLADFGAGTLAEALYDPAPRPWPLLTALLVLDAEVNTAAGDDKRLLPLPAFMNYRAALPPDRVKLDTLRLPPLNLNGHYRLVAGASGGYLALRLDLHPKLGVAGHVRLAASGSGRAPERLRAIEQRLEWQVLSETLIETAVRAASADIVPPLPEQEQAELGRLLREVRGA